MEMDVAVALRAALAGVIATVGIDLAGVLRKRRYGVPGPDWGLVGRWVCGLACGRWMLHAQDRVRPASAAERLVGWGVHYAVGIALALGLSLVAGPGWLLRPAPVLTIAFGFLTVVLPFCVMQPALGAGIAARKTLDPVRARVNSLITHGLFGCGLFFGSLAGSVLLWWL